MPHAVYGKDTRSLAKGNPLECNKEVQNVNAYKNIHEQRGQRSGLRKLENGNVICLHDPHDLW